MTHVVMVTEFGEEHGLINTLQNSVPDDDFKDFTPENKEKMKKQKKEDSRMVKARYINHRGNHERLSTPYMKYAGEPIRMYHLIPGYTYELPKGFVDQVNDHKGLAQRSDRVVNDKVMTKDQSPLKLHELVPISF